MRKHAEHTPDTIWGHALLIRWFESRLRTRRLPHALLLHGPDGVGKRSLAFALAKLIISQSVEGAEANGVVDVSDRPAPMIFRSFEPDRSDQDDLFGGMDDLFGGGDDDQPAAEEEPPPPPDPEQEPEPEVAAAPPEKSKPAAKKSARKASKKAAKATPAPSASPASPAGPPDDAAPAPLRPIDARVDRLVSRSYPVEYDSDDKVVPTGWLDLYVMEPIGKSRSIRVEQTRTFQDVAELPPIESDHRVCVILQADAITGSAANSLLKLIEEPPRGLVLILVTDHYHRVLETIRSRCVSLPCQPLPREDLTRLLIDEEGVEPGLAAVASALSEGRPGLALEVLSGEMLRKRREVFEARLGVDRIGPAAVPLAAHRALGAAGGVGQAANLLMALARDRLVRHLLPESKDLLVNGDLLELLDEVDLDPYHLCEEADRLLECLDLANHPAIPAPQPALELALWPD